MDHMYTDNIYTTEDEFMEDEFLFKRKEFIYEHVFNNNNIEVDIPIDFSIGTIEEWGETCKDFNEGRMYLCFATIYIVYNRFVCSNKHPFKLNKMMTDISHLLRDTHIIHDDEIRE